MIHLHVRDGSGSHTLDADAYREAIAAIRQEVGDRMVVQITSEALDRCSPDQQMTAVKEVRPEAVSLALRELAPDKKAEPAFGAFLRWLREERVVPQIILYEPEEAVRLHALMLSGLVPFDDLPVLYVLGRYRKDQASAPRDLLPFVSEAMPRFGHWMTCAFGRHEAACVTAAALMGGHVRVGFENNLLLPDGSIARSNAALVGECANALRRLGQAVATVDDLRTNWSQVLQ
jgi:uncharacterized protein (DUF849 family)